MRQILDLSAVRLLDGLDQRLKTFTFEVLFRHRRIFSSTYVSENSGCVPIRLNF